MCMKRNFKKLINDFIYKTVETAGYENLTGCVYFTVNVESRILDKKWNVLACSLIDEFRWRD